MRVKVSKSREISLSTWDHLRLSIIQTRPGAMGGGCWPISVWTQRTRCLCIFYIVQSITATRILCFPKSCNKTAYHWCYIIHRITTKSVSLQWFDTLTFTDNADCKWASAALRLGQRRGQVRWEGDIDQSAFANVCQSDLSVSRPYWRWFVMDYIGIKIYLCNTIKFDMTLFINYLKKWHAYHDTKCSLYFLLNWLIN